MKMEVPLRLGFRFCPLDEEIIIGYLLQKVNKQPLPTNGVVECDLYGDEKIWQDIFQETGEKSLYFFTNLKSKKTDGGSRIYRRTVCGFWKAQKNETIVYGQKLIGSKKIFLYVAKGGSSAECQWTMQEYRLDGCLLMNNQDNNFVICRIRNRAKCVKESGGTNVNVTQDDSGCLVTPLSDAMSLLQIQEPGASNLC